MNKKKILYIHHGGFKGGASRSLAFLINELDKEIYDVYIAFYTDFETSKKLFESVGATPIKSYVGAWHGSTVCPVTGGIFLYNIKHIIPTYFDIKRIVRKINPDLIHLNSTCLCYAAKSIRKSFPNIPIICHVREPLQNGFWGDILRRNCNRYVDRYIAIDSVDAKSIQTVKNVDIIYNFVDFSVYNNQIESDCLKKELDLKKGEKILLYLAKIQPSNGALEALKALSDLLGRREDVHFCIVGGDARDSSKYSKEVRDLCDNIPNAHMIEYRTNVAEIIASSDVMIVPFQAPHFARSIIEAAAMGVPAIASNVGGIDELIVDGETGYLVEAKTQNGIEKYCEILLDNSIEYARISRNAIKHAKANFDAKVNAKRTFKVYDEIFRIKDGD